MKKYFVATLIMLSCVAGVQAQGYPDHVIRVIVGMAPGGSIDVVSRLMAQKFTESMRQSCIVENRTGAAGTIGTSIVAAAPPNGYTLTICSPASISAAPSMFAKMPYDPIRDLTPIALIAEQPSVLIVNPSVPVHSITEFLSLAKANPGKLTYGSSGIGATQHLSAVLLSTMTGVDLVHVPYKGGPPAMNDLLAGQIDFSFAVVPTATPHIKSGRVRAIAVTSMKRVESLPDIPTLDESGVKGFDFSGWIGFLGPAKLPREVVMKLNAETLKALSDDILRKKLIDLGLTVVGSTPEQFEAFIKQDTAKISKIVKSANIPRM